jgi:hypothetical protein
MSPMFYRAVKAFGHADLEQSISARTACRSSVTAPVNLQPLCLIFERHAASLVRAR